MRRCRLPRGSLSGGWRGCVRRRAGLPNPAPPTRYLLDLYRMSCLTISIVGSSDDQTAVEAVVRDYFEDWFTGNVDRIDRALHPDLVKRTGTRVTATQLPAVT